MYAGTHFPGSDVKIDCPKLSMFMPSHTIPPLALSDIMLNLPKLDCSPLVKTLHGYSYNNAVVPTPSSLIMPTHSLTINVTLDKDLSKFTPTPPSPYCSPSSRCEQQETQFNSHVPQITIEVNSAKIDLRKFNKDSFVTYSLKVFCNGRNYIAKRRHIDVINLVKKLTKKGIKIPFEIPEVSPLISLRRSRPALHSDISSNCPKSSKQCATNFNYDHMEDSRKNMEIFLQSLLNLNEELIQYAPVQKFVWEPTTPKGTLPAVEEETELLME